ncbi:MAG: bicyclomycin/multidrug efflux system [Methanomethylovorans sp. PtaU1.Bin093]|uniref:multidrug effflux MFS transporter n=1 Tax=Methanomethylovorans sp. PtaU1.Bin093 TaxID=1811679 RepID=UPI0009D31857|nr:multidrug effflux MFS transporter [Methanomethylovorans sp. PtaU1.Bin093]OPY21823.1 MAG: bicyclomycin/multidrug efflux system [Methanomethylovorans sp. PtaU1.Bin093]
MHKPDELEQIVPLLALLTAFPAFSTDMILPAIPFLAVTWDKPLAVVNLILICFFVTYGFFLLIYGPISDRYGRRRPLIAGISLYIFASMLCALANSASMLIAFRILQAAGAAASASLSMAMTKDIFSGKERERILAYIAVIMALAPMFAPIMGGWVLVYLSWHWIFFAQGMMGVIGLLGVLRTPETLKEASETPLSRVMHSYGKLLLNKKYVIMVLVMSISLLPLYSFIAGSSAVYINGFGLSEQNFSYLFAFNALALMAGSMSCLKLTERTKSKYLITAGFAGIVLGGILILTIGQHGPWSFAIPMAMITYSIGISRPPSNHLVLEQVRRDAGSASSLLIFTYFTLGAAGMWLVSQNWLERIQILGTIALICGVLVLGTWLVLQKKGIKSA